MDNELIKEIVEIRAVVGYLGEKEQYNWWPSSFFSASSSAFLAPVFSRTESLARLTGVSRAASRVHDEYIGVGAVYHLFRLPEGMAQEIVAIIQQEGDQLEIPTVRDEALAWLRNYAAETHNRTIGPVRIGDIQQLQDEESWKQVAAHYLYAFENGERIYPYFRDTSE
jgi:ribosomal protein S28E/S33